MKQFSAFCLASSIFLGTLAQGGQAAQAARKTDDHLVPAEDYFSEKRGFMAAYRRLWQQKLLVTPGEVARFVHLPGNVGEEAAVSIYRNASKKDGKPDGYWLTVTQPTAWLWKCVPGAVERPIDPGTINIKRCDIPISESTALIIRKAWLAMLLQTRPNLNENVISLDSSTEIFFATNSDGTLLRARIPKRSLRGNNLALFDIANLLAGYCHVPVSEHTKYAHEVEKAAAVLLKRISPDTDKTRR